MIQFKATAKVTQITPALLRIFEALMKLGEKFSPIVVTSVNDSTHSIGSAHYRDEAVDIRCNDRVVAIDHAMVAALNAELGPKFLVLYENAGTPNEHIHIQLRKGNAYTRMDWAVDRSRNSADNADSVARVSGKSDNV